MSVNRESDKHTPNLSHLCTHAWKDVEGVTVVLGGDTTLKIVPMGVDRFSQPQTIAVVVSDVMADDDNNRSMSYADGHSRNISTFGHEEMLNVTCHVDIWGGIFRKVFTTPVSSTPHDETASTEKMTQVTRKPQITKTTKVPLNQTTPVTNETVTVRPGKERCAYLNAWIITVVAVTVVVVKNVVLLVACIIRKRRCCSRPGNPPPPPAVVPLNRWVLGGAGGHVVSTPVDGHQYSEIPDDYFRRHNAQPWVQPPYCVIPDEYYTDYYNTRPGAQNPYWVIPDEYYNYENTRPLSYPLTLRVPGQDDDAVPFYAAAAERGDAQVDGHPPTKPPDNYRGNGRGPGFNGPADYGGSGPEFDGPADYGGRGPGFDGPADYGGRGPGFNGPADYGGSGPEFDGPADYGGRGPEFDGPADYGGRGPGFDGPPDYGGRGPEFDGPADYGGCGPGFDGPADYGGRGPGFDGPADYGGRGPGFDGPADYGGRGPGFDGPADYGGRGPEFDGPADYGGRGPGFDGPADYGETAGRLFTRPESG
ncbi:PCF11 [Branchiostoma lanceolatum]|uniref:PCF11 protein n=1 Tax=Branchiostoma lanceolatum TaxID=7740 RepID=A0A8K0EXF7_BRALA|nr:PCF11 [Branchiostoma lanceolatum]